MGDEASVLTTAHDVGAIREEITAMLAVHLAFFEQEEQQITQ
jgi:hypothetical protein